MTLKNLAYAGITSLLLGSSAGCTDMHPTKGIIIEKRHVPETRRFYTSTQGIPRSSQRIIYQNTEIDDEDFILRVRFYNKYLENHQFKNLYVDEGTFDELSEGDTFDFEKYFGTERDLHRVEKVEVK